MIAVWILDKYFGVDDEEEEPMQDRVRSPSGLSRFSLALKRS